MDLLKSCAPQKHWGRNPSMPQQTTKVPPTGLALRAMCNPCMSGCRLIGHPVIKARTSRFDAQRDQELQSARAWCQVPEQQPQRDGAGIGSATVVDGVAFFLRAVDLRPGIQDVPSLMVALRASWLEIPVADFVNSMNTVYQEVLNGIFRQMPIAAWFRAQCKRI